MYCPKCGKQISDNSIFCDYCGVQIKENTNNINSNPQYSFNFESLKKKIKNKKLKVSYKTQKIFLSITALALTMTLSVGIVGQVLLSKRVPEDSRVKVSFDLNYPNSENFYQFLDFNNKSVAEPSVPQRDAFRFVGWYTSKDYSPMFDFSQRIDEDITLYAKWYDEKDTKDSDKDGLTDSLEQTLGTNPNKADSDNDMLSDYFELNFLNSNPLEKDTDGNSIEDNDEDNDRDGITNGDEMIYGTSPISVDTDNDGLSDYEEIKKYNTEPTNPDTDGDGANDGAEIRISTDPLVKDDVFVTTASCRSTTNNNSISTEVTVTSKGENAGSLMVCECDDSENLHLIKNTSDCYISPAYDISMDGEFDSAAVTFSISRYNEENFSPCLYYFDKSNNTYEEVKGQIYSDGKITVNLEHFSTYQILNKSEYGQTSLTEVDMSKYSKYSDSKDSNNDGISDLDTMLINDGVIRYNDMYILCGIVDCYGTDCDDWDGDGLKNGEEIKVQKSDSNISLSVVSNPILKDSDNDGFDDKKEIKELKSDPLIYTKDGFDSLNHLKNVTPYKVSTGDNVARFFEFQQLQEVENFLENYFYDYAPSDTILINQEKIETLTHITDGLEGLNHLCKIISNLNECIEFSDKDFTKVNADLPNTVSELKKSREEILTKLNEKKFNEVYKEINSIGKLIEKTDSVVKSLVAGEGVDLEYFDKITSIAATSLKLCESFAKVKKYGIGTRILKNYQYKRLLNKSATTLPTTASYVISIATDGVEGITNLMDAITSYSKTQANLDAYNDALALLYDLSKTNGLNQWYRNAAKNVANHVIDSSDEYTAKIVELTTRQILVTGSNIALDTLALINPYAAICKGFLGGVKVIGLNNMAECSIYMEIMNEMQKQCVNELNDLNIKSADNNGNGNTFTFMNNDIVETAEHFMTHLAQSKVLFEYYTYKYNYESGISSGIASVTGGVSKEKGEEATKNLIKSIYDDINKLELGVSKNLPYYDEFFDKSILSKYETKETSDERDVVLVMDISGSMQGDKLSEAKKAAIKFIDTVLERDASISIVTYDNNANLCSDFSKDKTELEKCVTSISANGGTNIEAGLKLANEQMMYSHAKKKIIVLMSDGEPNEGLVGDELVSYSDEIKNRSIYLYTLGFFGNGNDNVSNAQLLMEKLASDGCHYEVSDANNLVFFFDDIANMISGQKFIYVKVACPVDVSVTYNGETITSATQDKEQRAEFGTIIKQKTLGNDDEVKILRLKAENDYDINITGTGTGTMDYSVAFMNENGDYDDYRVFENVNVTSSTNIESLIDKSETTKMKIDEDGDGKCDSTYSAGKNEKGMIVDNTYLYMIIFSAIGLIIVLILLFMVIIKEKKENKNEKTN